MLKKLAVATAMILTLVGSSVASNFNDIKNATNVLLHNSVSNCSTNLIAVEPKEGGQLVLTANHCVTNLKGRFELAIRKEKDNKIVSETRYLLEVQKRLPKDDLALAQIVDEKVSLPTVQLASREELSSLKFGDPVIVAGYPGTSFRKQEVLFLTDGRFLDFFEDLVADTEGLFISTTAHAGPGMSGGGIYAQFDDTWKLIGVVSQRDPTAEAPESIFVPVTRVHDALKSLIEGSEGENPFNYLYDLND